MEYTMYAWSSRVSGLSYDAILAALVDQLPPDIRATAVKDGELHAGGDLTRTIRNRASFIAEKALELPYKDRHDFVDRKVWRS
jgi:hypothetical protein